MIAIDLRRKDISLFFNSSSVGYWVAFPFYKYLKFADHWCSYHVPLTKQNSESKNFFQNFFAIIFTSLAGYFRENIHNFRSPSKHDFFCKLSHPEWNKFFQKKNFGPFFEFFKFLSPHKNSKKKKTSENEKMSVDISLMMPKNKNIPLPAVRVTTTLPKAGVEIRSGHLSGHFLTNDKTNLKFLFPPLQSTSENSKKCTKCNFQGKI